MDRVRSYAGPLLLALGLGLMLLGIWREETLLVLTKAARICLECIGIG